jgi:hypothetical protein
MIGIISASTRQQSCHPERSSHSAKQLRSRRACAERSRRAPYISNAPREVSGRSFLRTRVRGVPAGLHERAESTEDDVWTLVVAAPGQGGAGANGGYAGLNGVAGTIELTWAPGVTAAPTIVNFGNAWVGLGNHHDVTVTNNSATAVTIGPITFTDVTGNPADFIAHNYCTKPLKPGRSCEVNAKFAPSSTETETATMNIDVDGSPLQVSLTGTGKVPTKRL